MSLFTHLNTLSDADKSKAVEKLITDSTPDFDFFLLMTLSMLMATFGLIIDSAAVVIGSMLIAPLLSPILSFSLGIVMSDSRLISRSFYTIIKSFIVGVVAAALVTLLFSSSDISTPGEVLSRIEPSLAYFFVAVIAGFAVSYSLVRPNLSATLPGIAVAVALIPPLAVVGYGIAKFDWSIARGAFTLFLINVIGIIFASSFSFSLMNLYVKRKVAEKTIKKEEKRLEEEKELAEDAK